MQKKLQALRNFSARCELHPCPDSGRKGSDGRILAGGALTAAVYLVTAERIRMAVILIVEDDVFVRQIADEDDVFVRQIADNDD